MRVSDPLLHRFVANSTTQTKAQFYEAGKDTVLLRQVEKPSDDLPRAQTILSLDRANARLDAFARSRDKLVADYNVMESALGDVSDTYIELKTLAVQMANDTLNADDRASGAAAADALRGQLLDLLSTRHADGRYIFAGVKEDQPAFLPDGTYQGGITNRKVEVAPGMVLEATLTGPDVFGGEPPFAAVDAFIAALETNNPGGIQAAVGDLDALISQTSRSLASMGIRQQHAQKAEELALDLELHFKTVRGELQDLDLVQAVSDFEAAEQTLEATISVSRRLMEMTVRPWLR